MKKLMLVILVVALAMTIVSTAFAAPMPPCNDFNEDGSPMSMPTIILSPWPKPVYSVRDINRATRITVSLPAILEGDTPELAVLFKPS